MYKVGDLVSYGLHGKCMVTGIETKDLDSGSVSFYQLKAIKHTLGAKPVNPKDPSILIPVENAQNKGLRALMTKAEAESALKLLEGEEDFFEHNIGWMTKQKTLEETIRKEGAIGLAKVVGHLYVMVKREAVPPTPVLKFYDNASRVLIRELSDALEVPIKSVETLLQKALRNRLAYEN